MPVSHQLDPTQTATLRRLFAREITRRFVILRQRVNRLLVEDDALGLIPNVIPFLLNARKEWIGFTPESQLDKFKEWVKRQLGDLVFGTDDESTWRKYVEAGFLKGANRAFDDVMRNRKAKLALEGRLDFYEGTREQFLRSAFGRPVAVEKVKLLASRVLTELHGVTDTMATVMSRTLVDGLVAGSSPRDIARDINKVVDVGRKRAEVIARTEIVRAHSEGQLEALEQLGVTEVGVAVEWSITTGKNGRPDAKVCPACRALKGIVLKVTEARGMLPRHPNCRCAWIPANVGEDHRGQKRTLPSITTALASSKAATSSKKSKWGPAKRVSKKRPTLNVACGAPLVHTPYCCPPDVLELSRLFPFLQE